MKRIIIVLLMTLSCFSCTESNRVLRHNVIVLVDFSQSVASTFDAYIKIIQNDVFMNLGPYSRLVVVPIDGGARITAERIVSIDLAKESFTNVHDGLIHAADSMEMRRSEFVASFVDTIEEELRTFHAKRSRYRQFTDILGSIEEIESMLEYSEGSDEDELRNLVLGEPTIVSQNILIILSDMIHESKDYSLMTQEPPQILESLAESGVPNLEGVSVILHGRTGKDAAQVDRIKAFWKEYFRMTGADILANEYDAREWIRELFE